MPALCNNAYDFISTLAVDYMGKGWLLPHHMQGQKRTRSSGPVSLIVSSFPAAEHQQQPARKCERAEGQERLKKPPKEHKQNSEKHKQHKHKQEKQKKQRHEKQPPRIRKEQPSTEMQESKPRKQPQVRKEEPPRSGITVMTKEKEEQMEKMMSRLSKISELKKNQEKRIEKEKQVSYIKPAGQAGEVLVDLHCSRGSEVRVYVDPKGFNFSVTFNHSDVSKNINKFYIMQILQSIAQPDQYFLFTRWGRVGLTGKMAQAGPSSLEETLDNYRAKVQEKMEHGYKKIETEYENQRRNFYIPRREKKGEAVESKLQVKLQSLIRLIFDMKMMTSQLKEIGFDSKRMPLGKIASATILKGYEALKEVMDAIKAHRPKETLMEFSSKFFSHIPHDFGMKVLANYVLDTEAKVRAKLELLQSLQDIQIFTKMIDELQENTDLNELDANYLRLSYDIAALDREAPAHAAIMRYVENTHAPSHNQYRLEVDTVYQLTPRTASPFQEELGNRQLLWHGSRLTNFVGILSSGLRIAPPQAPATGYMFGKGVYFADVVSKSANYCHATKLNPMGCLLLCEVALGTPSEKFYADYYANLLPAEFHSVKGVGRSAPKEGERVGDVAVPNGPLVETGISNTSLQYNQYVVYDVSQVRCRYLLKVKFVFK